MKKTKYFISDKIIEIASSIEGENLQAVVKEKRKKLYITPGSVMVENHSSKTSAKYLFRAYISGSSENDIEKEIRTATRDCLLQGMKLFCNSVAFPILGYKTQKITAEGAFQIMMEEIISIVDRKVNLKYIMVVVPKKFFKRCEKITTGMLESLTKKIFRNPYPAADIIIKKERGIVLVYRKNFPTGWAIPGGFINYGESAENAAIREAKEETGLEIKNLKLFGVFSKPGRDTRFHTISIVFTANGKGEINAGDDARIAKIFYKEHLPENIAFDHREILMQFFNKTRYG